MSEKISNYISSEPISLEKNEIIINQIKSSTCQIILSDKQKALGYFCKIPFPDEKNLLPIILTSNKILENHYFDKKEINILTYNNSKVIRINMDNRLNYSNDEYDIAIIEIKEDIDGIR